MKIERVLTQGVTGPVADSIEWKRVDCLVLGKGDEVIFKQDGVEVPAQWSQNAANILASKYLRRAGVPIASKGGFVTHVVPETGVPGWLLRSTVSNEATFGSETSARQVFHRMAGCWTYWGWREGLFVNPTNSGSIKSVDAQREEYAQIFYDELYAMLARQIAAPNSPQWFNTGLHWAYGIEGSDTGQWFVGLLNGGQSDAPEFDVDLPGGFGVQRVYNSYERPQPHACFIQPVADDLVNEGGMMDLWTKEARLFKHGSGTGSNFSKIRAKGEPLSGGGKSSGLMSFLPVGDRSAGSIKSGGINRRAAKMVIVNLDHPEIREFVTWKGREEHKAASIAVGSRVIAAHLNDVVRAIKTHTDVDNCVEMAMSSGVPKSLIDRARAGEDNWAVYDANAWEGEAIETVSGQNANNSVRVTDEFLKHVEDNIDWPLTRRTDGSIMEWVKARELWDLICQSTWASGDPGVQFHDTIQAWHTCPGDGEIEASNPCFPGDTLVWTIDGARRFDELARDGQPVLVLTELNDGKLAYRPMINPRMTRQDAELIEITFRAQTGPRRTNEFTALRCTPSHEFYLRDGRKARADALKAGDRIESAYRRRPNVKGYIGIVATNGDSPMEHWLIAEVEYGRRPRYPEEHGHHIIGKENVLGNVEIVDASAHNSDHMRGDKNPMRWWFKGLSDEERAEHCQKLSVTMMGSGNPNYGNDKIRGRRWINNKHSNRRIHPNDVLPDGWQYGKIHHGRNHVVVGVRNLSGAEDVYCGTVPSTGRFFVSVRPDRLEGVLVSNCSEYLFLNDNACNLASLRLTAFLRPDGSLDLDLFEHACRLWTMVLEISVEMASFPSKEIALGSYNYRTLGLGHADGGGLLMRLALPYDSDEGRALIAGLTALMTGVAYRISAEMASEIGPFPRWEANAESMHRVLINHARSLTNEPLEGVNVDPYRATLAGSDDIRKRALGVWADVIFAKSFRNAQTTLVAPTGTISFVMDCDTFGIEPDYALVKEKHLAGGGKMRIVNQAVPEALKRLGYDSHAREGIQVWINQNGTLDGCGDLKSDHRKVFDCVAELRPMAHVMMVAAIQPFLSGAASKTANLPNDATVDDVRELYEACHRLGVKAIAPFRDGSKMTQPLAAASTNKSELITGHLRGDRSDAEVQRRATDMQRKMENQNISPLLHRGIREYLPWRRENGYSQKAKIGDNGQTLHWRVSNFPDGRPGELFIVVSHEGSTLRALAESIAIAVSTGLQHGVPLDAFVDKFVGTKFEPAGIVEGHDRIKFASSITDLIARDLAITYLGRDDLAEVALTTALDDSKKVVALDRRAITAASPGYVPQVNGDVCPGCGGLLVKIGPCRYCQNCSYNTGCGG